MLRLRAIASFNRAAQALLFGTAACAQAEGLTSDRQASGGSENASGGTETGGMAATGGAATSTGGAGTGGNASVSGGATATGGATSGGTAAQGGSTSSGGSPLGTGGSKSTGGSPGNPGDQLLSDDFEDREAADWYPADMNGTREVKALGGSFAYVMTSTTQALSVGGSAEWVNQRVEAKVQFVEAANSPTIYLMARWAEAKSNVIIEFRPGDTSNPRGDLKLRQRDAGSTADICRFKPASVLPGTWYTIGMSLSGGVDSVATLLFDGQPVTADVECKLSKANPVKGGVAVGVQNGSAAFDDIVVTVP